MDEARIRVVELFAGVGGFRLGLDGGPESDSVGDFETIWSSQWEPSQRVQWASDVYISRFGPEGHSNEDINIARSDIPEHDLLVGGFPCQDYSVARTVSGEMGIEGEKGALWIPIKQIIRDAPIRPKLVFLENVPRLLNSPKKFKGRNFATICHDLMSMGYDVEWRVINPSDYGMPQKRRRVFIIAYRRATQSNFYRNGKPNFGPSYRSRNGMTKWLTGRELVRNDSWKVGPFARAFPLKGELGEKKERFPETSSFGSKKSVFDKCGYAWKDNHGSRWFWSFRPRPIREEGLVLGDVILDEFDSRYLIDESSLPAWEYAKSKKKEYRIRKRDRENVGEELWSVYRECMESRSPEKWDDNKELFEENLGDGAAYRYNEGGIPFPDSLDRPARTITTSEIGSTPDRMRHIIRMSGGQWRRLTPIELERLNGFPDDWTNIGEIPDSKRGFLMGNAVVVGVIERMRGGIRDVIGNLDNGGQN